MDADLYDEARDLGARIAREGRPSWAHEVDDAIAGGSTGSEIVMALAWTAGQIAQDTGVSSPLRKAAADLQRRLQRML